MENLLLIIIKMELWKKENRTIHSTTLMMKTMMVQIQVKHIIKTHNTWKLLSKENEKESERKSRQINRQQQQQQRLQQPQQKQRRRPIRQRRAERRRHRRKHRQSTKSACDNVVKPIVRWWCNQLRRLPSTFINALCEPLPNDNVWQPIFSNQLIPTKKNNKTNATTSVKFFFLVVVVILQMQKQ